MKKLLSIIGAIGLAVTGASNIVACNNEKIQKYVDGPDGPIPAVDANGDYIYEYSSNKLSSIAIAGIVLGSVAGVAFVVLGSCYLYQYLNKKKKVNKK